MDAFCDPEAFEDGLKSFIIAGGEEFAVAGHGDLMAHEGEQKGEHAQDNRFALASGHLDQVILDLLGPPEGGKPLEYALGFVTAHEEQDGQHLHGVRLNQLAACLVLVLVPLLILGLKVGLP